MSITVSHKKKPNFNKGKNASMFRCPHPGCDHAGAVITKVHCRMHHNMERDDMIAKYGEPIPMQIDSGKRTQNLKSSDYFVERGDAR